MTTKFGHNFIADNIDQAWSSIMSVLVEDVKETAESRDGSVVGEIINAMVTIEDPTRCILMGKARKLPIRYLIGELLWYNSGSPKLKAIQNYTKAWDRMSDDGDVVNSNYGHIIQHCRVLADDCDWSEVYTFDQYEYVKELLRKDPNSRQAIIHIKTPRDTRKFPTKDLNCTVCLQFFIRQEELSAPKELSKPKLYMTTYMRSNDAWMGFPNDVFQFTAIQIRMAMELGVEIGSYTHMVGSLHLYERDYLTYCKNISENATDCVDGVMAIEIKEESKKLNPKLKPKPKVPFTYGEMDGLI